VRLDVFELLASGPRDLHWIATRVQLPLESAQRLLDAAVALRLLEHRGHPLCYGLAQLGAALRANPGALAMIRHHELLYADLQDPVAVLRGERPTRLARYWAYAGAERPADVPAAAVAEYTALMSSSQQLVAEDVLEAYDFSRHRHWLDLGGGDGTFVATVLARVAGLRATLFDLPAVTQAAAERFARLGLAARAGCAPGDFRGGALPADVDLVTLVRVLHDHDDAVVRPLLRTVGRALGPGGALVVAEPMSGTPGAVAMGDAYFGWYLLAMGSGRPRSAAELTGLLHEAGFRDVREVPTRRPLLARMLVARAFAGHADKFA
jgi:demethylspheroidene O-methyltransferase